MKLDPHDQAVANVKQSYLRDVYRDLHRKIGAILLTKEEAQPLIDLIRSRVRLGIGTSKSDDEPTAR